MTISESIITWLQGFDSVSIMTDRLDAFQATFGLIKAPSDTVHEDILGLRWYTQYYRFLIRKPCSTDLERITSQCWLEELVEWTAETDTLPQITDPEGICESCEITTSFSQMNATMTEAVYGLVIAITYRRYKISSATVTFQIVNGTWNDSQSANILKEITLYDGRGTLPAADVPRGMISNTPSGDYKAGSWDKTPNTEKGGLLRDVTYTYIFPFNYVSFADADFELAFRTKYNVDGNILPSYLDSFTGLALPNSRPKLKDIRDIGKFHFLQNLSLYSNSISDITPIASILPSITGSIYLADQGTSVLEDISALRSAKAQLINLNSNAIHDITPLEESKLTTELQIAGNQIKDISPLATMESLSVLLILDNYLTDDTDFSPLYNLPLRTLRIIRQHDGSLSAATIAEIQSHLPDCTIL